MSGDVIFCRQFFFLSTNVMLFVQQAVFPLHCHVFYTSRHPVAIAAVLPPLLLSSVRVRRHKNREVTCAHCECVARVPPQLLSTSNCFILSRIVCRFLSFHCCCCFRPMNRQYIFSSSFTSAVAAPWAAVNIAPGHVLNLNVLPSSSSAFVDCIELRFSASSMTHAPLSTLCPNLRT